MSLVTPSPRMIVIQIWIQKSSLTGENATASNINMSMQFSSQQLGIKNFTPLKVKPLFLDIYMGNHTYHPTFLSALWSS